MAKEFLLPKDNPEATGSFSLNRKVDSVVGEYSFAVGQNTVANGKGSHTEGYGTTASDYWSHAEGQYSAATGTAAHAEGYNTTASGTHSHAEGDRTRASGEKSHAEGTCTVALASGAHAEGSTSTASNTGDHAEGSSTIASGGSSHAEGSSTTASGGNSHAEGFGTKALNSSHAEGGLTVASGLYSHTEGYFTTASGLKSHSEGDNTIAASECQHVQGQYNVIDSNNKYADIVGGGNNNNERKNISTLDWDGNAEFAGNVTAHDTAGNALSMTGLNTRIGTVENIAKGRNQAHVFSTTADMQEWLLNAANKGKYSVGDNIYIAELNVPDWWVAEVLETADSTTGYYYKISQLETQKVDLTEYDNHISNKSNPHAVTKTQVGLSNVPNVSTNDQTPTFTQATTRANVVSGEKTSTLFGKIMKWFADLKAVAFSGSYNDLSNKPTDASQSAHGLMSVADKKKLDGIASGANAYSLPLATSTIRGGAKVGYSQNGKNYPVQLSNEQMYVNVPWTDTNTQTITGVKGSAESSYRTGNVNITKANLGLANACNSVVLSKEEYNALTDAQKNDGTVYYVTGEGEVGTADQVDYDNTTSKLAAANVQAAIDENSQAITQLNSTLGSSSIGELISLSSYTKGQLFTAPSDGYIYTYVNNSSITFRIYGKSGNNFIYCTTSSSFENTNSVFIRKGMRIEVRSINVDVGHIDFYPLV